MWWVLAARLLAEIARYISPAALLAVPVGWCRTCWPGSIWLQPSAFIGSVFGLPVGALVATSG